MNENKNVVGKGLQWGYDVDTDGKRKELGRGASGITYRGWILDRDSADGGTLPVALKCFERVIGGDGSNSERGSKREFKRFGGLKHPHIVEYLRLFHDDHRPIIATKFIKGSSLKELIDSDEDSQSDEWRPNLIRWTYHIAGALSFLEQCNIIHRDIKPANLMVTKSNDHAILIDFGVGVQVGGGRPGVTSDHGQFVGTYAFASPEQFPERDDESFVANGVSFKSDVYSLGMTLAFSLCRSSVDLKNVPNLRGDVKGPYLDRMGDLPATLVDLIRKMTDRNPAERPDATHVRSELGSLARELFKLELREETQLAPDKGEYYRGEGEYFSPDAMPDFVAFGDGDGGEIEIATTLLSEASASAVLDSKVDASHLDSAKRTARMSFLWAMKLLDALNEQEKTKGNWIYRLPTRSEWMEAAKVGDDPFGDFSPWGGDLEDLGCELEWLSDPAPAHLNDCRFAVTVGQEGAHVVERHEQWPKGTLRLVRNSFEVATAIAFDAHS
jgi:serine/threonine protein kinase